MLNGISSQHYNRREHRKRLEDIQNDLDAAFEVKPEREKPDAASDYMAGPARRKILAQRQRAKQLGQPYKP